MLATVVFALAWALIAFRRVPGVPVGRTAGALVGAVGMVAIGALTPRAAYAAIDNDTLALLLGMMGLNAYLEADGVFDRLAGALGRLARGGLGLLVALCVLSAALSALLVNDAVCLFLTPVAVAACRRANLPIGPYLIAVATGANIGSAASAVGNPQNMILAQRGAVSFGRFLVLAGPAAAAALAVNLALLAVYYGRRVRGFPLSPPVGEPRPTRWSSAVVLALVTSGFLANLPMGWCALAGTTALVLIDRVEPDKLFAAIDWTLLLFFACLFVAVAGFETTGLPAAAWTALEPWCDLASARGIAAFTALVAAGSNVVSNVPLVLLISPWLAGSPDGTWVFVAFVSTLAGNLTLVGSVANLIVAQGALPHHHLGFWEYLRFGAVSTALTLAVGVPVLLATARLLS